MVFQLGGEGLILVWGIQVRRQIVESMVAHGRLVIEMALGLSMCLNWGDDDDGAWLECVKTCLVGFDWRDSKGRGNGDSVHKQTGRQRRLCGFLG